jgi:hypothetical protein
MFFFNDDLFKSRNRSVKERKKGFNQSNPIQSNPRKKRKRKKDLRAEMDGWMVTSRGASDLAGGRPFRPYKERISTRWFVRWLVGWLTTKTKTKTKTKGGPPRSRAYTCREKRLQLAKAVHACGLSDELDFGN